MINGISCGQIMDVEDSGAYFLRPFIASVFAYTQQKSSALVFSRGKLRMNFFSSPPCLISLTQKKQSVLKLKRQFSSGLICDLSEGRALSVSPAKDFFLSLF